jgi:HTH-type transcriptional regulator, glycine betaine synthesis regulator
MSSAESVVVDTMGRLAEAWGLKRNVGRCWAVLFLLAKPTTATELQKILALSTGSVSMTLRELQRWGVIRLLRVPEERHKLYVAEVDVWRVVSRMLRARALMELSGAIDNLEEALSELRLLRDKASEEERSRYSARIARVEGLLDLLRIVSSMLRVLVATAKLDAGVLAAFRLGGSDEERGVSS